MSKEFYYIYKETSWSAWRCPWNSLKIENKKRKGRGGDSLVRVTNALNITITYKFKIR